MTASPQGGPDAAPDAKRRKRKARRLPPALLSRESAAAFLTISASSLDRLSAAAEVPAPLKIGGRVAWGRAELSAWVRHGGPDRATWARLWPQIRDRRPARR